jgi:CheY-like chemotaxis protein
LPEPEWPERRSGAPSVFTGFRLNLDGGQWFMADLEGKPTILIVDDEEMVRSIAAQILEKLNYRVVTAASGAEAIETFEQAHGRIDLVILDMIMPGIDGSRTFDEMKKVDANVKVILSSGYSRDSQANDIMRRGCDAFIQKPFRLQELSQLVESLIAS